MCECLYLLIVQGGTNTAADIRWKWKECRSWVFYRMITTSSVMIGIVSRVLLVLVLGTDGDVFRRFVLHASSFRNLKIQLHWWIVQLEQATLFLSTIRKKKLTFYLYRATPTSSQVTLQLVAQLEREDANTSYLTSSRQSQHSPPSLFLPEVEQATAAQSVVVTSSHKATLSPSTTPSNAAPTAAAATAVHAKKKHNRLLANHFSSGEVLANKKWRK